MTVTKYDLVSMLVTDSRHPELLRIAPSQFRGVGNLSGCPLFFWRMRPLALKLGPLPGKQESKSDKNARILIVAVPVWENGS